MVTAQYAILLAWDDHSFMVTAMELGRAASKPEAIKGLKRHYGLTAEEVSGLESTGVTRWRLGYLSIKEVEEKQEPAERSGFSRP
jgi:hypothetical protein